MSKDWDSPWKSGAGLSKPGIGDRPIEWPAYGGTNPTCAVCGGRARGKKRCECAEPDWKVCGKALKDDDEVPTSLEQKQLFQAWCVRWLKGCYRVLKPGGIIKVFGATRMFHRMAAAMEQAGFLLPPGNSMLAWGYGSGFPKYLNTSKAIDQHLGKKGERPVIGQSRGVGVEDNQGFGGIARGAVGVVQKPISLDVTGPATPEAARFDGWATALKPGWEPFVCGVKPPTGE